MATSGLRLQAVHRRVAGDVHLHPIDLELRSGVLHTLLGPTGAGKTTLLRLIAGLDPVSGGRIQLDERDLTERSVQRRNVAFVYQRFVNYPNLDVFENIASPLRVAGVPESQLRRRVVEVAAALELEPFLQRLPGQLSGGQQQRCALARALAKDADLILLDEPLANLDLKLRERLREVLPELLGRRTAVVLWATTDPTEALIFGGPMVVLDEGRVLQVGSAQEVYRRPLTRRVASIVNDPPINLVRRAALPHLPAAPAAAALGIRAHHLRLQPADGSVALDVEVELAELDGSSTRLHVFLGQERLIAQAPGVHDLGLGARCRLHLHPADVLSFDTQGARL